MERIQIQPIQNGLDGLITAIEPQWGVKPLFGTTLTLILLLFNEHGHLVGEKKIEMEQDVYLAKGENKEERFDNVLIDLGITKKSIEINA